MCIETTFIFDLARKAINLRTDNKMAKINRKWGQTVKYKTRTSQYKRGSRVLGNDKQFLLHKKLMLFKLSEFQRKLIVFLILRHNSNLCIIVNNNCRYLDKILAINKMYFLCKLHVCTVLIRPKNVLLIRQITLTVHHYIYIYILLITDNVKIKATVTINY